MRIRSLLTCLALYVWGNNANASTADFDAFVNSKYTYCDAKVLSSKWTKSDVYESKELIGYKLRMGSADLLEEMLHSAHSELKPSSDQACKFTDLGLFSLKDINRLASHKNISVEKAKTIILNKVAVVSEAEARKWYDNLVGLNSEPVFEEGCLGDSTGEETHLTFFFQAGYDYCHAKLLAKSWNTDVYEAKSIIGNKVATQTDKASMQKIRHEARQKGYRCEFNETAFSLQDAATLAKEWNIDVDKAKIALSDTYVSGVEKQVKAWLSR